MEENLPQLSLPDAQNSGRAIQEEIRIAENNSKRLQEELAVVKAKIQEQTAELQRLSAESEIAARRQKQEAEEAVQALATERLKLERAAQDASEKAQSAKEEMAKLSDALERQRELAVEQGIAESFERGKIVDKKTRFDSRTKRDPRILRTMPEMMPGAASFGSTLPASSYGMVSGNGMTGFPAGIGEFSDGRRAVNFETATSMYLDNRLKSTETFFELRRMNRAARALEAGPAITMEDAIRLASKRAPRQLTDLELDPFTGDITWPLVLTDPIFDADKRAVQDSFRERARGVAVSLQRFSEVQGSISSLRKDMKANIDRYLAGHYGKASSFLDSLLREFEKPL